MHDILRKKIAWRGNIKQTPMEIEEGNRYFSAFTVTELGVMLPKFGARGWIQQWKDIKGIWRCEYKISENNYLYKINDNDIDTETDARAKMMIYLLENNIIELSNKKRQAL
jgi:hypothetical protein